MEARRRKHLSRLILGLFFGACVAWLARLDLATKISTDVLDLIPVDEREPELTVMRRLAREQHARIALFALDAASPEAASAFSRSLQNSPAFAEVVAMSDPTARDAFGRHVFDRRFELLLPAWLARHRRTYEATSPDTPWPQWLARQTTSELERFLTAPGALAFESLLPADPLLLVPRFAAQAGGLNTFDNTESGDGPALFWTRTTSDPFSETGQVALFSAVDAARQAARTASPETELRWTATSRFAAASRAKIKSEVMVLNLASLIAVLGVAGLCLRRSHQLLHLVPVVGCALLGAWTATTMVFARVHILVLVVGALLAGIAIDYALHIALHARPPGESYAAQMRSLRKPLLTGAFTTLVGFSFLFWSDLPFIRQLGVFVTAGLLGALGTALLWFAQLDEPVIATRPLIRTGFDRLAALARTATGRLRLSVRLGVVAGVLIAIGGMALVRWQDDIRELEPPQRELYANDREVRALFGETAGQHWYITRGETPAEARGALEEFLHWAEDRNPDATAAALGRALPTRNDYAAMPAQIATLREFAHALRTALESQGFDSAHFASFFLAWNEIINRRDWPDYEVLVPNFVDALRGPLGMMVDVSENEIWFVTVVQGTVNADPPASLATVDLSQVQTLNRLFERYRRSALRLSVGGLLLAGIAVLAVYGWRRGGVIFGFTAGACLFAFGLLGLAGQALNLFHLFGAFLGVCLCLDYFVFATASQDRGEKPPLSIRLSALTTAASFGVLSFSTIPVVAALGSVVTLLVVTALLLVEMVFPARAARAE